MTAIVTFTNVNDDQERIIAHAKIPDGPDGNAILVAANFEQSNRIWTIPFLAETQEQIDAFMAFTEATGIVAQCVIIPDHLVTRCKMRLVAKADLLDLHRDWVKAAGVTGLAFMRALQHRAGTEPSIETSVAVSNAAGYA